MRSALRQVAAIVVLLLAGTAFADGPAPASLPAGLVLGPPPPGAKLEAVTARATAAAFLSAGVLDKALEAIREAIRLEPRWAELHLISARIRLALAGPGSELSALAQAKPDRDYAPILGELQGATADLERYLKLVKPVPEAMIQELGALRARVALAQQLQQAVAAHAAQRSLLRQAEDIERADRAAADEKRRIAEEQSRQERERQEAVSAAEQARLNAVTVRRRQAQEAIRGARARRIAGYTLLGGSGLTWAAAGLFGYLGSAQNKTVKEGPFPDADALRDAAATGSRYNKGAYACLVVGGLLAAIGVPLIVFSPAPKVRFEPMTVRLGGGANLKVSF